MWFVFHVIPAEYREAGKKLDAVRCELPSQAANAAVNDSEVNATRRPVYRGCSNTPRVQEVFGLTLDNI